MAAIRFLKAESEEDIINRGGCTKVSTYLRDSDQAIVMAPINTKIDYAIDDLSALENRIKRLEEQLEERKRIKVRNFCNNIEIYKPFEIYRGMITGVYRDNYS